MLPAERASHTLRMSRPPRRRWTRRCQRRRRRRRRQPPRHLWPFADRRTAERHLPSCPPLWSLHSSACPHRWRLLPRGVLSAVALASHRADRQEEAQCAGALGASRLSR